MKYLSGLFKKADTFGSTIELQFEKQAKYNTIFGGILTIITYALTIALIISLCESLVFKDNPRTNSSILYKKYMPQIHLEKDDIKFGIGYYTSSVQEFYDPRYFTYTFRKFILDKRDGFSITKPSIKSTECKNLEKFWVSPRYNFTDLAKSNQMDNFFCFQNQNHTAEGSFSENYFENFQVDMYRCKNSTKEKPSNTTCVSDEEINTKLLGGFFEFIYVNKYIDTTDFENPVKEYMETYFITTDPFNSRFVDIYFKTVNITTDIGLVFEDKRSKKYVMYDYTREQSDINSAKSKIVSFFINSSKNYLQVNRSYFKLTDMAAIVGGIFNVYMVVGEKLSKFFSEDQIKIKILNTLFFFDAQQEGKKELISISNNDVKALKTTVTSRKTIIETKREKFLLNELQKTLSNTVSSKKKSNLGTGKNINNL